MKDNKARPHSPTAPAQSDDVPERIAKRMARAGLCSRRDAERWISDGRVQINGKVLKTPACVVSSKDVILVDGEALPGKDRTRLWLLNKKSGLVTTNRDPEGRKTVFEALPEELPRVLSVGRLDINTEGLLLLTNDGGLARVLELPATGWLRRYRVRAHGAITQGELDALKDGVAVDGVLYGSIDAELERQQGSNVWLTFAMREGKNREVKKVLASLGLEVNRLIRLSYGPFQLGDLPTGQVREVRGRTLREQLGGKLIELAGANFDLPPPPKPQGKPLKPKGEPVKKQRREKVDPLSRLDTKKRQAGGKKSSRKQSATKGTKRHADRWR